MAGGVPGCLFTRLEIVISPACHPPAGCRAGMAGRFSGCEHNVIAMTKPIAGIRENGFDKFPGVRFMSSDVPTNSRNIGKETEVKTN